MIGGIYFAAAVLGGLVGIQGALPAIETDAGIAIGGVPVTGRVRIAGLTIHDILNDAPNTCTFTIEGEAPAVGQRVRVTIGNRLLFAGAVQTIDQAYELQPQYLAWDVTAIDDTAEANARRPFGTFLEVSATVIAQTITATYAPGFSTAGITPGLPPVTIVFDGADTLIACLARLATAIGGYCQIDDRVVYLFLDDTTDPPNPLTETERFLAKPPIQVTTDASQLRTRVYGKGYGETIPSDLHAGSSQIPIEDGALFPPLGGTAIVGLTPDGAQSDVITFTGVVLARGGSLVGPGASPTTAPDLELKGGSGVTDGLHTLSVAFRTATGQSIAGPPGEITAGMHPPPPTAPTAETPVNGTGPDQGTHDYAVEFVLAFGVTGGGPISNAVTTTAALGQLPPPPRDSIWAAFAAGGALDPGAHNYTVTFMDAHGETTHSEDDGGRYNVTAGLNQTLMLFDIPIGPAGTTGRRIYRAFNSSEAYYRVTTLADNTTTEYVDAAANASLGPLAPVSNTTGTPVQRIPVTNIPLGPPGVTARNLYRRFNGGGPFKRVTTLADNTTTTFTDSVTNAALGAALGVATALGNQIGVTLPTGPASVTARELYMSPVGGPRRLIQTIADNTTTAITVTTPDGAITGALEPTADTSGLQQPQGQVNPGSPTLPVASSAPFPPNGWVLLGGGQVVWHSGISGNTLIGIPPSGAGAITTAVLYGQQAMPSPMLTGVTGLTRPLRKGSAVHIWIQRDDLLAQAEHAARTGGDGIVEFLIVDTRRGVASLAARCDADLALFSRPIVTVAYATRDLATRSGKPIVIDLPSQGIHTTLTIQDVTITEIGIAPGLAPRFTVKASSVRFSLEDILRRLVAVGPVTVNG